MNNNPTVAISGASGFIGRSIVEYFAKNRWNIRALQRTIPFDVYKIDNVEYFQFVLPETIHEESFYGADLFIHCAYQPYNMKNKNANDVNIRGTLKVIELGRKYNVRIVFLSTLSAHEKALSNYGKNKLELEKLFDLSKDLILRLGLVIGKNGGLFVDISKLIKNLRFVPLIDNGTQPIQTLYINELFKIIETAYRKSISGIYNIAEPDPIKMKDLYCFIIKKMNLKRTFIPVPLGLVYFTAKMLETMGLQLSITTESVLGLKQLKAFETREDLKNFEINLLPAEKSIEKTLNSI